MYAVKYEVQGIEINGFGPSQRFNVALSREEAIRLITSYDKLPFDIMCDEANTQDDDWVEIGKQDIIWENGIPTLPAEYEKIEVWI